MLGLVPRELAAPAIRVFDAAATSGICRSGSGAPCADRARPTQVLQRRNGEEQLSRKIFMITILDSDERARARSIDGLQ